MAEFQLKQRTRRPSTRSKSPRKIKIINFKLEAEDSMNVRNWWLDSLSKDGMTASKGIRSNTKMHDSPLTAGMTVRYRIAWQLWLLAESQIKLFKIQLSNQEKKNDTASPGSPELKPPRMSQDACLSMFTLSVINRFILSNPQMWYVVNYCKPLCTPQWRIVMWPMWYVDVVCRFGMHMSQISCLTINFRKIQFTNELTSYSVDSSLNSPS